MMLAESIGGSATTALRRNAIHKLEKAAAEAAAAGLTWREAREILEAGYGYSPANTYAGAADLSWAAGFVDSPLVHDVTRGERGWLSWDLPHLTDPQWHLRRPDFGPGALVVEVPANMPVVPGEYDMYWARPIVEQAVAKHSEGLRHGVDAAAPANRDGYPLGWLSDLLDERGIAADREWATS